MTVPMNEDHKGNVADLEPVDPVEVSVQFVDPSSPSTTTSRSAIVSSTLQNQLFRKPLNNNTKYISIQYIGSTSLPTPITYPVSFASVSDISTIIVTDSATFSEDSPTITNCIIQPTIPVNLSKTIISLPGDLYHLLKSHKPKEINASLRNQGVGLIREGDSIFNGKVLLCEPNEEGMISEETEIIVTRSDELEIDEDDNDDETDETSNLINQFENGDFSFTREKKPMSFNVKPLKHKIEYTVPMKDPYSDDDEHILYASSYVLGSIGAHSGDFVTVRYGKEEDEAGSHILKILSFIEPHNFDKNTLYVSPLFLLNHGYPHTLTIQRCSSDETSFQSLPIPDEITISRVSSPLTLNDIHTASIMANLKAYFESQARVIELGDLIPIVFDSKLSKVISQLKGEDAESVPFGSPDSVVWFQVESINKQTEGVIAGEQFLFKLDLVKLEQSGALKTDLSPPSNNKDIDWVKYLQLPSVFQYPTTVDSATTKLTVFPYVNQLRKIISTTLSHPTLQTAILLTSQTRAIGKTTIVKSLAYELGLNLVTLESYELLQPGNEVKTIGTIRGKLDRMIGQCPNLIIYFRHLEGLTVKNEEEKGTSLLISKFVELVKEYTSKGAIIISSVNDVDKLNEEVRALFKFEMEIPVPSEPERLTVFKHLLSSLNQPIRKDVSLQALSLQSAGLTASDLVSIVKTAQSLALKQHNQTVTLPRLTPDHFISSINDARSKFSDAIGAPRIPTVTWDDIGGLDIVKGEILDTIELPLKHPELFSSGVKKRSGILFYGPPGTGKTLLAKAIASNFSLNFFSVKGPELLNMYIGESEANVRKVFQRARDAKPCVVFFDELDSVAPKRGNHGDSGGVMDRIVSQLLAELDGMSSGSSDGGDGVFVVGATNRPDLLDEALLRPGRFDKLLYLGISDTTEKQRTIMEALTRKFKLGDDVDLQALAEKCPFNFTGADFYALCSDSMLNAMTRVAGEVDEKLKKYNEDKQEPVTTRWWFDNVATDEDIKVEVTQRDFVKSLNELKPSVSQEELNHYLRVRENFEGGKKKESG
ncbi:hypothetical protein WICPIJ_001784 [Wickerhamomyces pijperi]|uniref:Peroxisomal ATPase PEX6 n=1 Tax=Wickerhamomyces pijperi TaxID=599730 RepID=A0A9P8QA59_WICPI|nr:hypothetical protein WICPIJ_001784 [Wickerhamomyces pijperi]